MESFHKRTKYRKEGEEGGREGGKAGAPSTHLGLLETSRAILIDDWQAVAGGKGLRLSFAGVDQRADDADPALAGVVRFHGAGLGREGEREGGKGG